MLNEVKFRLSRIHREFLSGKMIKILIVTLLLINIGFSQTESIITIHGNGNSSESAHITVTTDAYKCPGTPGQYVVEDGASLTTWDPTAICGATTSGAGDIALPVELTNFTAEQVGSTVLIKWTTESEIDNLGFMLDRREEATDWINIADYRRDTELIGYGTTSSPHDYEFTDNFVKGGATYNYRLADVSMQSVVEYHNSIEITVEAIEEAALPNNFVLYPAYPNPFNPVTTIRYDLPVAADVKITVYNELGKVIAILKDNYESAGFKSIQWNGRNANGQQVAGGVYLYRIEAGDYQKTMKMILLK